MKKPIVALKAGRSAAGAMKALVSYGAYLKKNKCAEAYISEFLKKKSST